MKILVDGTEKELTIRDPKTGTEWTQDLIESSEIEFDDEKDMYTCTAKEYDWWKKYIEKEDYINKLHDQLRNEASCFQKFDDDFLQAFEHGNDMQQIQDLKIGHLNSLNK